MTDSLNRCTDTTNPVPRWVTAWPAWFGIEGNTEVVPASDYDRLRAALNADHIASAGIGASVEGECPEPVPAAPSAQQIAAGVAELRRFAASEESDLVRRVYEAMREAPAQEPVGKVENEDDDGSPNGVTWFAKGLGGSYLYAAPQSPDVKRGFKPTHRHEGGGLYEFLAIGKHKEVEIVDGRPAAWVSAAFYRNADGTLFSTSLMRWNARFRPLSSIQGERS